MSALWIVAIALGALCLLVVVVVACSVVVGARADRVFDELRKKEETRGW